MVDPANADDATGDIILAIRVQMPERCPIDRSACRFRSARPAHDGDARRQAMFRSRPSSGGWRSTMALFQTGSFGACGWRSWRPVRSADGSRSATSVFAADPPGEVVVWNIADAGRSDQHLVARYGFSFSWFERRPAVVPAVRQRSLRGGRPRLRRWSAGHLVMAPDSPSGCSEMPNRRWRRPASGWVCHHPRAALFRGDDIGLMTFRRRFGCLTDGWNNGHAPARLFALSSRVSPDCS